MKSIFCALLTLLLSFPVIAKLNAYQEARINAMLDALAQKSDLISCAMAMPILAMKPWHI